MSVRGVYLAYPIDQRGPSSLVYLFQQIEQFKRLVIESSAADWVYDPGDAFKVGGGAVDEGVALINRAALNNADVVVAFLPRDVVSIGVPMEVDRAHAQGKHIIVFSDAKSYMLNLPRVNRFTDWDPDDIAIAVEAVRLMEPAVSIRQIRDLPVKVDTPGCLPKRSYDDDAGLDLIVAEDTIVPAGGFADVPCGVSVELPDSSWGLVTGRSSALRTRGLLVHSGVIDAGYRGPLFAGAWNQTDGDVLVVKGERIAQLILIYNQTRWHQPIPVEALTPSMRGTAGFGSTGR